MTNETELTYIGVSVHVVVHEKSAEVFTALKDLVETNTKGGLEGHLNDNSLVALENNIQMFYPEPAYLPKNTPVMYGKPTLHEISIKDDNDKEVTLYRIYLPMVMRVDDNGAVEIKDSILGFMREMFDGYIMNIKSKIISNQSLDFNQIDAVTEYHYTQQASA